MMYRDSTSEYIIGECDGPISSSLIAFMPLDLDCGEGISTESTTKKKGEGLRGRLYDRIQFWLSCDHVAINQHIFGTSVILSTR